MNFDSGIKYLIDNERLDEYPQLVGEMTSRFSVLSSQIISLKVRVNLHFLYVCYSAVCRMS